MTPLPAHIARCKGQRVAVTAFGYYGTPTRTSMVADQCHACRRRTDPPHERQVWTGTPEETPCALRIGEAEEA
jgi:hypothetical protein